MRNIIIVFCLSSAFILTGCGHTNELAKYDLTSKAFYFEDAVAPGAQQVNVDFSSPLESKVGVGKSENVSAWLDIAGAVTSIVSAVVSSETQEKLESAIDMNEVAYYVSQGIEEALARYYTVQSVESLQDNPEFIVETILISCQLGSSDKGVSILVEASSRIIDRKTATIVWEYSDSNVVPVTETGSSYTDPTGVSSALSVISAAQLADLSEKEIQAGVYNAAAGAGAMIAEVLREDIAEIRGN